MSTIKRIVLATGVVAAIATSAGQALADGASVAPTTTLAAAGPGFVLPAGYVQLTDDTGTITVAVPSTWTDVSTLPSADAAGNPIPRITAATNYQVFHDTFNAPGVEYVALAYNPDQQGLMTEFGLTSGCTTTETVPYNDGAFVGLHGIWTGCGPTGLPEWHQIVVAPTDNSRTLILQIQTTGPAEAPVVQNILDSFNLGSGIATTPTTPTVAGVPTVPTPTVPGVPTIPTPTVPGVPTVPLPTVPGLPTVPVPTAVVPTVPGVPTSTGAVPPGFVQLVDDTQAISMIVPSTWIDVDTAPFVSDSGAQAAQIMAATNIEQWQSSFSVPGARLLEFPYQADPAGLIADIGLEPGSCPTETVEPFTNGTFTGNIGRWAGCGASGQAEYDVIVASPADQSVSYIVMVQSTGPADQAAIAMVLSSFGPAGQGVATAPSNVPVPPATNALPTIPTPTTAAGG